MKTTGLITIGSVVMALATSELYAGSATWDLNPASGDWNTAANWSPTTAPNGPSDTATFGFSNTTGVSLSEVLTECRKFPGPMWEIGNNFVRHALRSRGDGQPRAAVATA